MRIPRVISEPPLHAVGPILLLAAPIDRDEASPSFDESPSQQDAVPMAMAAEAIARRLGFLAEIERRSEPRRSEQFDGLTANGIERVGIDGRQLAVEDGSQVAAKQESIGRHAFGQVEIRRVDRAVGRNRAAERIGGLAEEPAVLSRQGAAVHFHRLGQFEPSGDRGRAVRTKGGEQSTDVRVVVRRCFKPPSGVGCRLPVRVR